ncbi:hypothetical protein, variant 3 [Verruconis gallopava]|uniref:MADS-box domain-containing protein n=1 Tax=Verruconis gallopava TaxID=253628 RepID=A0A0D2BDD8_9PEZI|nr:uncharacterized protein PV09_00328 [Verruconis gallopava]XP_016219314.1 hypothetical protein, variant 1 [Verruconis gallopava]XP_016219315.1 hypothetical protein, variant 2 [Verruconis gallopava]XP_016219316.1 hypothetical protein, variant 3 [Verruconis gallopava]KIW09444.1 hypothetical protein PV09_00328 [Verruconis gallopava]KIW09445.1 hypothetical protein, variant 1 [Verruconis gallopava]KIW09446.1 hypothetical protein, variant 2 [Verruconis gallopava]KIW09447.1 hypothetical protein, v
MATEITEHDPNASPSHDDQNGNNGVDAASRGVKRPRGAAADDDDDDEDKPGRERRKIEIKFIQDKSRRHITFSKRKAGIMKKAYELSVLTGTQVLLLVVSETGLVYTFTTPKLQPLVTKPEGKNLIQACLNAPEPQGNDANGIDDGAPVESPDDNAHNQVQRGAMPPQGGLPYGGGNMAQQPMTPEQAMQYQNYLSGQNQYPPMPHNQMPGHRQQ